MAAPRALLTLPQDGHVHANFRGALYARGMTHDDGHLLATMMDIVAVDVSVDSIRRHFARLLVHSAPQDARALFHQFAADMCDGDPRNADVVRAALGAIEVLMSDMGRTLTHADYGFEQADMPDAQEDGYDGFVRRARRRLPSALSIDNATVERDRLVAMLNVEQRTGYDTVMAAIGSQRACNIFAVLRDAGKLFSPTLWLQLFVRRGALQCVLLRVPWLLCCYWEAQPLIPGSTSPFRPTTAPSVVSV